MSEIKNTIELKIYNEELEIKKTYKSYGLKWKAFKKVMSKQKEIEKLENNDETLAIIFDVIKMVYPDITEDDLDEAYIDDIFNCFGQVTNIANNMAKNF